MHHLLILFVLFSIFLITSNALEDSDFFEIKIDRDHPDKVYEEFEEFIVKYKKKYKSPAEKHMRMQNFLKSHNKIQEFNRVSNESGHNTHFEINKFSDLSNKEFQSRLSKIAPREPKESRHSLPLKSSRRIKRQAISFPDYFDLRYERRFNRKGVVTSVKNQGLCACCWGFAAAAVAEAVYAQHLGNLTNLSVQELCDCATAGSLGCTGGNPEWGVGHVFGNGLASDADYKWEENRANETGMCVSLKTKRTLPVGKFDFHRVDPDEAEYEMMVMLTDWGSPIAVSFAVGERFRAYEYGVLRMQDCWREPTTLFHAGAIIGFGEEYGTKYWIVKNSWGSTGPKGWGDEGYFKVIRGENWCDMERMPAFGGRLPEHTHA